MPIKLYFDFMSQPSRSLYIFLKLEGIPFEQHTINLLKGEHRSEDFKKNASRFQKVPVIHDDDLRLTESIAIARYLARKHDLNDHWYPKESRQQALVDEYLEWQHNNTRIFCATYVQKKWVIPYLTGKEVPPRQVENAKKNLNKCLDEIEKLWLAEHQYLTGDKISLADIFAACEIEQTRLGDFDPRENRPVLSSWLDRVRNETNPFYDEAHALIKKVAQQSREKELKRAKM